MAEDGETEAGHYAIDKPITLDDYNRGTWEKLRTEGRRAGDNPIAARLNWPRRFEGTWEAFSTFPRLVDPLPLIQSRRAALISRWNSAALNRWLIRYNFRPQARMAGRRRREDDRTGPVDDRHRPRAGR